MGMDNNLYAIYVGDKITFISKHIIAQYVNLIYTKHVLKLNIVILANID